jgi:hypothetical protein
VYTVAHAAPNTITWQEFRDSFRVHHIPSGVIKLKQREFLALKQGNMSVNEYLDKFTQLCRCDNPTRDNFVLSPKPLHLVIKR